eukprot:COSAG05_NODE_3532_length_2007_cov_8.346436_3_plen_44_part_01
MAFASRRWAVLLVDALAMLGQQRERINDSMVHGIASVAQSTQNL